MKNRLGMLVEDALRQRGRSKKWLAAQVGIQYKTLWKHMTSTVAVNRATLARYARVLRLPLADVVEAMAEAIVNDFDATVPAVRQQMAMVREAQAKYGADAPAPPAANAAVAVPPPAPTSIAATLLIAQEQQAHAMTSMLRAMKEMQAEMHDFFHKATRRKRHHSRVA